MTNKVKFSKMSFRIHRRTPNYVSWPNLVKIGRLRSCRKVAWFTKQKNSGSAGLVLAPILSKMGRSHPKLS